MTECIQRQSQPCSDLIREIKILRSKLDRADDMVASATQFIENRNNSTYRKQLVDAIVAYNTTRNPIQ